MEHMFVIPEKPPEIPQTPAKPGEVPIPEPEQPSLPDIGPETIPYTVPEIPDIPDDIPNPGTGEI